MDLADGITQEDLSLFLQEADEQLQLLDEDIVRLEKEENNPDLMQEIFRAAHTLKGSSAMIGHNRMAELAHAMENVLDNLRKGTLSISPQIVDALLHGLDIMRELREELVSSDANEADITGVVAELEASMEANGASSSGSAGPAKQALTIDKASGAELEKAVKDGNKAYRIAVTLDKETAWASVRCFQILQGLSGTVTIVKSLPSAEEIDQGIDSLQLQILAASSGSDAEIREELDGIDDIENIEVNSVTGEELAAAAASKSPSSGAVSARKEDSKLGQTVRVDVSRLDTLMEQVGELVINGNRISQIGKMLGEKHRDDELVNYLGDSLSQISKIISTIQQDVMTIRMLPIEIVFNTLPRMVRDLARKVNKRINWFYLQMVGGGVVEC